MTPEAQRLAIAEACGFSCFPLNAAWGKGLCERVDGTPTHVPDYLTDLNAMYEAEKVLTAEQARAYDKELQKIGFRRRLAGAFWLWHFTADWKAEAFLRTIGRWEGN
jgi:hypothetical protein